MCLSPSPRPLLGVPAKFAAFRIDFLSSGDDAEWEIRLDSIRLGQLPLADYNADGHVEQADLDLVLLN